MWGIAAGKGWYEPDPLTYVRNPRDEFDARIREREAVVAPPTEAIAEDAAWLRGKASVKLPDAVHIASARTAGATAFITNDRRIGSHPRVEVFYLDDLVLEDPAAA